MKFSKDGIIASMDPHNFTGQQEGKRGDFSPDILMKFDALDIFGEQEKAKEEKKRKKQQEEMVARTAAKKAAAYKKAGVKMRKKGGKVSRGCGKAIRGLGKNYKVKD